MAISAFTSYRQRAKDSEAIAQIYNFRTAIEAYLGATSNGITCNGSITPSGVTSGTGNCSYSNFTGFTHQQGVSLGWSFDYANGTLNGYILTGGHCQGSPGGSGGGQLKSFFTTSGFSDDNTGKITKLGGSALDCSD